MNSVLVIGGGAAGMLAAISAARSGARVTLLESNEKLGKKVYITGKGRCNVTNACEPDAFLKNVVRNPRFLYSALSAFPPSALMDMLEALGCPLMVERGDRVFPRSEKASDVTRAFEREMNRLGVRTLYHTCVKALDIRGGRCTGAITNGGERYNADAVVLCTGGMSYPSTGSTGDGWRMLRDTGHTVLSARPALSALNSDALWIRGLQGLTLKNVRLTLKRGDKKLFSEIGEMLFTHFGLSGPLTLSASSYLALTDAGECSLTLDLKPGMSMEQLDARLVRDVAQAGRRQLHTLLCGYFPARLAEVFPSLCGADGNLPVNELTRETRASLAALMKALPLPIAGPRPIEEAIVTCGGVSVGDINPATMESKRLPGLYVAGEMLDVDAMTGGFNLHIAFCTGMLAGRRAAENELGGTV